MTDYAENIKIGSTSYPIRDAEAAHSLPDIASAGNDIVLDSEANYKIIGNAVYLRDHIASGFTTSSYIQAKESPFYAANGTITSIEFVTKFVWYGGFGALCANSISPSDEWAIFSCYVSGNGVASCNIVKGDYSGSYNNSAEGAVTANTPTWFKCTWEENDTIKGFVSTDGTTFTKVLESSAAIDSMVNVAADKFVLGLFTGSSPATFRRGTIDLDETYLTINGNKWTPYDLAKTAITVEPSLPALTDIASAGSNITFSDVDNYTEVGSAVTVTDGVASGFTTTDYLQAVTSPFYSEGIVTSFDIGIKFNLSGSLSGVAGLLYQEQSNNSSTTFQIYYYASGSNYKIGVGVLGFDANATFESSTAALVNGDNWLRVTWSTSETTKLYHSTDGVHYTKVGESSGLVSILTDTNNKFAIGYMYNYGSPAAATNAAIDLENTYVKVNNTVWTPIDIKKSINTATTKVIMRRL